jgi:probable HAF family extracellular repeat protein
VFVSVNTEGLLVKLMFEVNSNSFDEIVGPPGTSQRDMETRLAERERYYSNRPVINGYSVVQLSGLGEWHVTYDINDNGEVVGAFAAASDGKNPRAFYWSPITQRMQDLGTFGGRMSAAHSINSGGDVVGWAQQADGRLAVFAWWPEAGGLREIAGMRERVKLGWMPRLAINDAGQIVGQTEDVHLFLWSPTRPNEIVDLGEDRNDNFLKRFDLSNDGRVAFAKTSADGDKRATLWSAQTGGRDLGVLNDHTLRDSAASAVSPNGRWVVGSAGYGAFIWSEATGMKRLPRDSAYAVGVNDHGDVIGNDHSGGDISNAKYRAVVWLANSNHEVRFLPVDGMTEGTVARAINNAGQIVGTFNEKAVVWDPIVGEASGR